MMFTNILKIKPYHPQGLCIFKIGCKVRFCKIALWNIHEAKMFLQVKEHIHMVGSFM